MTILIGSNSTHMLKHIFLSLLLIIGWFFAVPLSWIIPKKKNLILFIGAGDGQFRDNAKYLFLYLHKLNQSDVEYHFLTENAAVFDSLKRQNLPAVRYPGVSTIYKMLRAAVVVVDNLTWINNIKFHFLIRSYKVQLWHGCSIKSLELDNPDETERLKSWVGRITAVATGRFPHYDLLLSTSRLNTKKIFKPAFKSKKIIEFGYPRNDILFRDPDALDMIGADQSCMTTIEDALAKKIKTVLYAPTFRDTGSGDDFIEKEALDIGKLNQFGQENNIIFIFKIHPFRKFDYNLDRAGNILRYHDAGDIYPLLSRIDLLITDYSSIFFDYLFVNRPILFFPYDYEKYISEDRDLKYDYFSITPGPKCYNQDELQRALIQALNAGQDDFAGKRKQILDIAFTQQDGESSERILAVMRDRNH